MEGIKHAEQEGSTEQFEKVMVSVACVKAHRPHGLSVLKERMAKGQRDRGTSQHDLNATPRSFPRAASLVD